MSKKKLLLGTALWGWGINKQEAFALLDAYERRAGVWVDTAVNYPINKNPNDMGLACRWLSEWCALRPNSPLKILLKIGAVNNIGGPEYNLQAEHLNAVVNQYRVAFARHLAGVAIHWDNRSDEHVGEVEATLKLMAQFHEEGVVVGFSGVKNPELYRNICPELANAWWIQVKENIQTQQARAVYTPYFPDAQYYAYSINMGGIKQNTDSDNNVSSLALRGLQRSQELVDRLESFISSAQSITPSPKNFNELALLYVYSNPHLAGAILGARTLQQLNDSLQWWQLLENEMTPNCGLTYGKLSAILHNN